MAAPNQLGNVPSRPVFIFGAPLSGMALLASSLRQHPNFGPAPVEFRGPIGAATPIVDDKPRVTLPGCPGNGTGRARTLRPVVHGRRLAEDPIELRTTFPEAFFIHMVRDVKEAVAAGIAALPRRRPGDVKSLATEWSQATEVCRRAERALGREACVRIRRRDLLERPYATLRRLLHCLGEPFDAACTWPLEMVRGAAVPPPLTSSQERQIPLEALATSENLMNLRTMPLRARHPVAERTDAVSSGLSLFDDWKDSFRRAVCAAVPPNQTVLVVSKGDEELLELPGRSGLHFPQGPDGGYAGFYPATSAQAIAHLEELRAMGACYLAVPASAYWWLEHYHEFALHLLARYEPHVPSATGRDCLVYSLAPAHVAGAVRNARAALVRQAVAATKRTMFIDPCDEGLFDTREASPPRVAETSLGGEMWGITAYYNPAQYRNKSSNFRRFRRGLRSSRLPLLVIEVAFGDQDFELSQRDADILVRLRGNDVLWQKERILNLALDRLPSTCDKVVWLDADVVFTNSSWAVQTARLLEKYMVVQPFTHCVRLGRGELQCDATSLPFGFREREVFPGMAFGVAVKGRESLVDFYAHGHTGYAWAARRELLERHGLYEMNLLGNGDADIAHAMYRNRDYWSRSKLGPRVREHLDEWSDSFGADVDGSVGYAPGTLTHLWHGDIQNRLYHQHLAVLQDFDPRKDLTINPDTGLYEWSASKKDLRDWCRRYFFERKEDG